MISDISRLFSVSRKDSRMIVGLMSGTSLDGLDVALCEISGAGLSTEVRLVQFETVAYTDEVKSKIRHVFARQEIDFEHLVLLNEWLGILHGKMVSECLCRWGILPETVDCIASHGQTVFHAPKHQHNRPEWPNATLQIGDGDHIAVTTGIITLSDFRQKHLAAGGEGAPLAVYGDYLLFSAKGENRIMLNMGGIANITFLPDSNDVAEIFVSDTGPGNTLLDAFAFEFTGVPFDKDAELSRRGVINSQLLHELKNDPFFKLPFPKTTGPELFNKEYVYRAQSATGTSEMTAEDLMATLTAFSAETIAEAIALVARPGLRVFMSGGGMHNPLLTSLIQERVVAGFLPSDALGIPGDAKEAVLFAVLANETLAGNGDGLINRPEMPKISMGKISLPR